MSKPKLHYSPAYSDKTLCGRSVSFDAENLVLADAPRGTTCLRCQARLTIFRVKPMELWATPDNAYRVEIVLFADIFTGTDSRGNLEESHPLPGPGPQFKVTMPVQGGIYTRDLEEIRAEMGLEHYSELVMRGT